MPELPTGTLTFLFTDIEGSTRLLQELGDGYRALQDHHSTIVRAAITEHEGVVVRTEGDSFFAVFPAPSGAVGASVAAQRALAEHDWPEGHELKVRMGMHTGEGVPGGDDYLGLDVNRAARIAAAAWGGQVVMSDAVRGLVEPSLPRGVAIRDLGIHRLKDLARPEHLYDLVIGGLVSGYPPLRSLDVPIDLPVQLTSFVGREDEIASALALLDQHRLVTLTGSGGTGKTRLGIRVASEVVADFPDGVSFVDLSSVVDPALVVSTVAASLGLREEGWERPVREALENHIRDRQLLLLLDNFEQVLDAAGDVSWLLSVSARSKVIVTSRRPLRLQGEHVLAVAPLQVPDGTVLSRPGDLPRLDAVALFADRAASIAPGFSLTDDNVAQVAEICARLDGLPLAIELAASRAALLSPGAMLQLMERPLPLLVRGPRDVPARQRTLRGAIDWSYELLTDGERMTFRRLSTLAGGSTLQAATAVCDPDGREGIDVLEGLATLVDSSLIRAATGSDDVRYDMLRTVREFGAERLEADDDRAAIERRHACWFLRLAEEAEPHFRGPELERWLRTLEVEHDNLRAAIRWALEEDEAEIGLRLAGSMWRLWHLGGYISEGRHWVTAVLSLPSASEGTRPKAKALAALGGLAYWQNDVPAIRDAYEQALAISRELEDDAGIAEGSYNLGFAYGLKHDRAGARALFRQSLEMFERLDDPRGVADSMWALSLIARLEGDLTDALDYAEGSERRHRELGDLFGIVDSLHELGRASLAMGNLDTARSCFLEVLETVAPFGYRTGMSIALDDLAAQEIGRGEIVRALRLRSASEALKESSGGRAPAEYVDQPDPRATARSSMGEQQMAAEWEEGAAMTVPEIVAYARGEQ